MVNDAYLPVQERLGLTDLAAECLDDRLVAEAHAERGHSRAEAADQLDRYTSVRRTAWARRNDDPIGRKHLGLLDRDHVVAVDGDICAELLEEVHEIPRERVVVVDHEELHAYSRSARSIAASSAASLARHSRYSAVGSESATMPAPAWSLATPSPITIL